MAKTLKIVTIKNCQECPHVEREYEGQGVYSFYCGKTRRHENAIATFCENHAEEPQNHIFPEWCPLENK